MSKVIRIRKNAHKKIEQLLNIATLFEKETHSSGLDDSLNSNGYSEVNRDETDKFIKENYSNLIVEVKYNENNQPKTLWIQAGAYYFCPLIRVTFAPRQIETVFIEEQTKKPRINMATLNAYLKNGFLSPLNHGGKADQIETDNSDENKVITKIEVLWSESSVFNTALRTTGDDINKVVSLDEYNRLEWLTLANQRTYTAKTGEGYGYDKTMLQLTLKSGEIARFRHDICVRERNLQRQWSAWVDHCQRDKSSLVH